MNDNENGATNRRDFLGKIIAGATILGMPAMVPFDLHAAMPQEHMKMTTNTADAWMNKITGKHRMVLDVVRPNEIFPFAWSRVFLLTNSATGTPEKDCGVVVVLRHAGIPYAMKSELWEKYHFGEMFKADDPLTKAASTRNPFWEPKAGDFSVPGIGNVAIGINELQASGVMFCVCNMAITVYSAVAAQQMSLDPAVVKKEWMDGILPGIQVVPSGVWAVGRAQEKKCAYCYAG